MFIDTTWLLLIHIVRRIQASLIDFIVGAILLLFVVNRYYVKVSWSFRCEFHSWNYNELYQIFLLNFVLSY